jgi:hypothetical protein
MTGLAVVKRVTLLVNALTSVKVVELASIVVKKGKSEPDIYSFWQILTKCLSHTKAECPNPKVFTGTCRICNKEGHPASACPDKAPEICRNCKQEGK